VTVPRSRKLSDDELFAFWRATGRMKYPVGAVYRFLLLTGLRVNEGAQLAWSELHGDCAIIPAARMKGRDGYAREHLVPFSSAVAQIIAEVPRIRGARYVFSCDGGSKPLVLGTKFKRELDRRMLRSLRAVARRRGDDHHAVELPGWVNHDMRRTIRSGLSALRVPREVAEAVLAHAAPGIIGTYDCHQYEDEKREALELWAGRVKAIANPEPATPAADKIVTLPRRR
jgi:integrase